ncbi:hypothetical protein [Azospirillum formosense]|nr:hypothetical protein [Azospirillum formosense]
MQAVRESYADIGLMRERGLSWADISDVLAKLGVTARDNQPISPVTLRSAFFLVGNEGRDGGADGEDAGGATPRETLDAVHRAALAAGQPADDEDAALAPEPAEADLVDKAADDSLESAGSAVPEPEFTSAPEPDPVPESVFMAADSAGPTDEPSPVPGLPPVQAPISQADNSRAPVPHISSPQDSTTNRPWKGDRMLGTIFVLNDRGGVGKTLLSHHLMATAMLEGLQLKVVEYEVNERLNRLFGPEVVEHRRITQDFMNMMGSGDGFYEFWDQIGPELQRGGRLYDFGGNISQWFFNWAEVSGFDYYVGEGERLTFMVPVTVDLASLSTGMNTLERIATIAPKAKRVLVENGFSGPFSQLDDSQYARRKAEMVEREGVEVISMAPCTAPAWARLTGHRIDEVAQMTREDLVKLGMTPPVASRSLIIIHEWLRTMRQALSPYLRDAFNQSSGPAAKTGARQGAL